LALRARETQRENNEEQRGSSLDLWRAQVRAHKEGLDMLPPF